MKFSKQEGVDVEYNETVQVEFPSFNVVRVENHWEVEYEDEEGIQSIAIDDSSWDEEGRFIFKDGDGNDCTIPKSWLDDVEAQMREDGVIE